MTKNEMITLYQQWQEVHSQYWEKICEKASRVITITKEELDFIINTKDFKEVKPFLDTLYTKTKNTMLKHDISLELVNWEIELFDWAIWEHTRKVSDWVYDILLNGWKDAIDRQKEKIWKWLNK